MCPGSPCSTSKLNNAAHHQPQKPAIKAWHAGRRHSSVSYRQGQVLIHRGRSYRCRQSHAAYGDQNWAPGIAHSLWAPHSKPEVTKKHPASTQPAEGNFALATIPLSERADYCEPPPYCDPHEERIPDVNSAPSDISHSAHSGCDSSTGTVIWHAQGEEINDNPFIDPRSSEFGSISGNLDECTSSSCSSSRTSTNCSQCETAASKQRATEVEILSEAKWVEALMTGAGASPTWTKMLHDLEEMGFQNQEDNVKALNLAGGDLKQTIRQLMLESCHR